MTDKIQILRNVALIAIIGYLSCLTGYAQPVNKWKSANKRLDAANFELRTAQTAIYDGDVKNFELRAHIEHSNEAKASLWIHTDESLTKGYQVLIGRPADDRRRSGSLATVRNLYKSVPSSFDLKVRVKGKRIMVIINDFTVVDYSEPDVPYRTAANAARLLSQGKIGFCVERGTLGISNIEVILLADDLPDYVAGVRPADERDDAVIRLQQKNFPIIDYHVHTGKGSGLEELYAKSLKDGFEYGIAVNCGIGFQVTTDAQVKEYLANNRNLPFFYAMQGEGREWVETFSKEACNEFDYIFTDALTFHDHKNRRTLLWADNTVIIDIPEQEYMDMIVERTLKVLNNEPIDIWVNPTLLSTAMMADYDKFWTDERVALIVKALKNNNIALEINARYKIPSARIIKTAKAAGVKFTLGTNSSIQQLDRLEYPLKMVEECDLTIDDMWFPKENK